MSDDRTPPAALKGKNRGRQKRRNAPPDAFSRFLGRIGRVCAEWAFIRRGALTVDSITAERYPRQVYCAVGILCLGASTVR